MKPRLRLSLVLMIAALSVAGCFARGTPPAITPTAGFGAQPIETPLTPIFPQNPTPEPPVPTQVLQNPTSLPQLPTATATLDPAGRVEVFATPGAPPPASVLPITLYIAPTVPVELSLALQPLIDSGRLVSVPAQEQAQVSLVGLQSNQTSPLFSRWLYVPVVPFNSVADAITLAEIQRYWFGDIAALSRLTETGQPPVLVTTAPVLFWLTRVLGVSGKNVPIVTTTQESIARTIYQQGNAWGMIPFHKLDSTLKALVVENFSAFDKNLPNDRYPFGENFGLVGNDPAQVNEVASAVISTGRWMQSNRDVSKITSLIMTGVTALTRATAFVMETKGITLPTRDIKPFLADADIIHTSNEVSFAKNCPYPNPESGSMLFCSREKYFELLTEMGVNLVELTGNHNLDWGVEPAVNSLNIYDQFLIPYFGGGRNAEDARRPAVLQHNDNIIAFLGCNQFGPRGAWATDSRPGAAVCDDAYLREEIPRLRKLGYVVVMTIQYAESYQYTASPAQQAFFRKYAQMGANIVIGSQAHQPQHMAFADGAFIHYGIGNLFFDQMFSIGTRQMFMDKFIIYEGRHISTVLFTGLIEDYSRPRPMTDVERAAFLRTMFRASGW